jgi:uncharacterized protein (TIGR02757 family)
MQRYGIKEKLENHYLSYKHQFSSKDPVWILHRFSDEKDIELIALITAAYAYGSVDQINGFIEKILAKTGSKPYEFTINFEKRKDKKFLNGLNYRFNTSGDLIMLIEALNNVLKEYPSLKHLFISSLERHDSSIINALGKFSERLNKNIRRKKGQYTHYLVSNPFNGSTCKRMNLFLRWMVRKDEIDTGIWSEIGAHRLIIPVDTHVARISKNLRLVKRKTIDLKFAIKLTEKLKLFDPDDPVKYDFALCHIGIEGKKF